MKKLKDPRFTEISIGITVIAILLPIVYILSVGPVILFFEKNGLPQEYLLYIYSCWNIINNKIKSI